ncbi:hypothetical protein T4D_13507 [Trichinella pseudospiralis]|uniref:Uncharacterized protein n=1 Tax=Trichinella pseudospiralis TaxID=6337 RepID=A0A0V1F8L0_TRIPS|nr:hypothetical protein T4D_13507 [Trichinella pseudospiralis]
MVNYSLSASNTNNTIIQHARFNATNLDYSFMHHITLIVKYGRSPPISTAGSSKRNLCTGGLYVPLSVLTFTVGTTPSLPGYNSMIL